LAPVRPLTAVEGARGYSAFEAEALQRKNIPYLLIIWGTTHFSHSGRGEVRAAGS